MRSVSSDIRDFHENGRAPSEEGAAGRATGNPLTRARFCSLGIIRTAPARSAIAQPAHGPPPSPRGGSADAAALSPAADRMPRRPCGWRSGPSARRPFGERPQHGGREGIGEQQIEAPSIRYARLDQEARDLSVGLNSVRVRGNSCFRALVRLWAVPTRTEKLFNHRKQFLCVDRLTRNS
jgi:hypothetical protein